MTLNHVDVIIVGAGLSGIGAACHLTNELPNKTYAVLESRNTSGGTWDLFKYPGIRSDSDMHTLGYNFKPWKHQKAIADGPAILSYIRETAKQYDVEKHIRYNHQVDKVAWDSDLARWTVTFKDKIGEGSAMTCHFIYSCTGYYRYDQGYTPNFPGIGGFKGQVIHPQHWPETLDYTGKRVVVIGSGATAITLVPSMAKTAGHVTMLQRSPTYVVSRPSVDDFAVKLESYLPDQLAYTLTRCKNVFFQMILYRMSKRRPAYIKAQLIKWTKHWLGDKVDVGKHFTPTYNPWDQRLCLVPDGDLFRSLRQGSSSVVTDHIKTFTDKGIELRSGETLEADIVVTATGLELLALGGMQVNVDGKEVDVSDAVQYKGMMLSDVPNLFFATGYTNASWTLKCDLTSGYVCRLIKHLDRHQQQICMPHNTDNHLKRIMSIGLESGYVMRSIDKFPKEGLTAPWKLYQNYFLDLLGLRMRSVKDGYMVFAKRGSIEE
ncbi:MAG TPA: FAD-containing monooxygenase EthA [Porticoccaceae bacterium]|nr:FAD-containing monooxygenase EthA [Porticoccaceae bacterium]